MGVPDTKLQNWKAADLISDEKINIFDLCLMKQQLVKTDMFKVTDSHSESVTFFVLKRTVGYGIIVMKIVLLIQLPFEESYEA